MRKKNTQKTNKTALYMYEYVYVYLYMYTWNAMLYIQKKEKLLNCLNKPDKKQNENNAF